MADRRVIIADGHHRYETAVAYAERHPDAGYKLMAFFALEAPGLTILPNHRLVHGVQGFDFDDLMQTAGALVRGGGARRAADRSPRQPDDRRAQRIGRGAAPAQAR